MMNTVRHRGFSLVELLIAMTIGLVILAVLGTVFSRTSSGRGDLDRVSRLLENARYAADIVGEDLRHAGFYGTFMPRDAEYDTVSPCAWNSTDVSTLGWRPNDAPPRYPGPMQGWDDPAAGVAELGCLPNRVPTTDVLVVRRASATPTLLANVTSNNVYAQASQCISDPALLRVSNTAAAFDLLRASCAAGSVAEIRRYFVRAYYVASCNDCVANDGIPTLKRVEYVNGRYVTTAIAEGVQNLQFEYSFDVRDNVGNPGWDGVPDKTWTFNTWRPDGIVPAITTANWADTMTVRMHLLMRSSEQGLTADQTPTVYDLGPNHADVACPDRFRCRLTTSTFRLNNVAARRER